MRDTQSAGLTLIFWFAGALYTLAWAALNIELGLSLPRQILTLRGQSEKEYGVPRSGGILNYVTYPCIGRTVLTNISVAIHVSLAALLEEYLPPYNLRLFHCVHHTGKRCCQLLYIWSSCAPGCWNRPRRSKEMGSDRNSNLRSDGGLHSARSFEDIWNIPLEYLCIGQSPSPANDDRCRLRCMSSGVPHRNICHCKP